MTSAETAAKGEVAASVRRFLDRSPLAVGVVDSDANLIAANEPMHDLFGHAYGSLDGRPTMELVHPDDVGLALEKLASMVERGAPSVTTELRVLCGDGGFLPVRLSVTDLRDDPGIAGILVVSVPVVAPSPEDHGAMRRSAWFEGLVAGSSDYSVVLDGAGRLLYLSGPRVEDDPTAELIGRTVFDLAAPDEDARLRAWFASVLDRPGPQPTGYLRTAIGGQVRVLEVRATNLLDDPKVGGILAVCRDVTDVRDDSDAARIAGHLVERSPLVVVGADAAGRITAWNPAAERVLGWTAGEVVGRRFSEAGGFTEASVAFLYDRLSELLEGGTVEAETTFLTRAGDTVPAFVVASGLLDAEGEHTGFLVLGLDLREQHALRSEAARNEARWSSIFRHTRELVATLDERGVATYVGPGFERVLGYEPFALVGTDLRDIVHPDDRARPGGLDDLARGTTTTVDRGYRVRHADGSWRMIDVHIVDRRHDPAIGAFVLNGLDVTARAEAEASNRTLAAAVDSAGAVVVITDVDQQVVSWNKRAERVFGLPPTSAPRAVGSAPPTLQVTGEERKRRSTIHRRVCDGGSVVVDTGQFPVDGRVIDLTSVVSPVVDATGEVTGVSWIAFDVTEQRAVERERERRLAQQSVVAEIGQRALAGVGVEDLLTEACELVARNLGVDDVLTALTSPDGSTIQLAAATSGFADLVGKASRAVAESWWSEQARDASRPIAYEDLAEAPGTLPDPFAERGAASGVLYAIEGRHGLIGVLLAIHAGHRSYDAGDLDFVQAVGNALGIAVERRAIDDELRHRALHDDLTGLPNRTLLVDRLGHALARSNRHGDQLALLFVDLDRFKRVNDTLGHRAGDVVLAETARRLTGAVRQGDTVARVGGDEFLVLCEDVIDEAEVLALAARIGEQVVAPIAVLDHSVVVSASIGITLAAAGSDAESLVGDADLAMYRAKQRGRARSELYDEHMREEVVARLEIEEALRAAVAAGDIEVVYQPVVDLESGAVIGVEALARWDHDQLGTIAPPRFLAVAADLGLVDELGGLVLEVACATIAAVRRDHDPSLTIAVNVSARQLAGVDLRVQILDALAAHDLAPDALMIELTETDVLDDHLAVPALSALREIGVGVSVDDFGTGYSSLQRVARLPVDEVKLDQSFVIDVGVDRGADAVIRASVTLAASLGMRLVAEGVERPDQRDQLLAMGCRYGQGWLFTPPLTAAELGPWLAGRGTEAGGDARG